jgi:hypothetical protein
VTGPQLVLGVGLPFAWWGAVLAVSFLETPLKFRAPGITVPLGLGIGRLVFRALNGLELLLALAVVVGLTTARPGPREATWLLLATVLAVLLTQVTVVRPRLDRRAAAVIAGEELPASRLHLGYIAGEVVKLLALPALGVVVAAGG